MYYKNVIISRFTFKDESISFCEKRRIDMSQRTYVYLNCIGWMTGSSAQIDIGLLKLKWLFCQWALSEMSGDDCGDLIGVLLDLVLALSLDHDTGQRLCPGIADIQAA